MPGESSRFDVVPFAESVLAGQDTSRLTQEERDAIESYALGGYELINRALRGGTPMTAALA